MGLGVDFDEVESDDLADCGEVTRVPGVNLGADASRRHCNEHVVDEGRPANFSPLLAQSRSDRPATARAAGPGCANLCAAP